MGDPLLIIRHAKRSGADTVNLGGCDLKELPKELLGLGSSLEVLNLSSNKLISLDGIQALTSLRELNLSNNLIKKMPNEIATMSKLKQIILDRNPILTDYPYMKRVGPTNYQATLTKYFGELEYEEEPTESPDKAETKEEEDKESLVSLSEDQLKKLVAELRGELKLERAKKQQDSLRPRTAAAPNMIDPRRSGSGADAELESERTRCRKLEQQIVSLENQLVKARAEKSFGHGSSLEDIQGVTEIDYNELKIEEEVGKGGFATIYRGKWRGTTVAIKRLFDPNVTEAQIEEVRNEIVTMAVLRHPKITMLLGICRKPPNICIVMECCKSSLFSLLHMSK